MVGRNEMRRRIKGRQTTPSFVMFPHHVLRHEVLSKLSPRASKLVIDLMAQYQGDNNGDLSAPLSQMRARGWNSSDQLNKAKKELINEDVIWVTRQGGRNLASLYALTWFPIDECEGKLDVSPTQTAPVNWRNKLPSPSGGVKTS